MAYGAKTRGNSRTHGPTQLYPLNSGHGNDKPYVLGNALCRYPAWYDQYPRSGVGSEIAEIGAPLRLPSKTRAATSASASTANCNCARQRRAAVSATLSCNAEERERAPRDEGRRQKKTLHRDLRAEVASRSLRWTLRRSVPGANSRTIYLRTRPLKIRT